MSLSRKCGQLGQYAVAPPEDGTSHERRGISRQNSSKSMEPLSSLSASYTSARISASEGVYPSCRNSRPISRWSMSPPPSRSNMLKVLCQLTSLPAPTKLESDRNRDRAYAQGKSMWSCERGHTRGEGHVLARAHRLLIVSGCSKVGGKPPSPRRELRLGVLRLVSCVELVAAVCKEAAANIELILREAICTRMNVARYQGIKRRIKEDDREQRHLLAAESMVVSLNVKTELPR